MTHTSMTCERLEELLPDYLDETLGESERLAVEAHLAGCPACGPLVADVRGIVAEAAALPALRPSRDLWAGIEARIATPVVSIGASSPPPAAVGPRRFASRGWLAAAAVLLVVTTAGITYEVTRRMQSGTPIVAQTTPDAARAATSDSLESRPRTVASAVPGGPFAPPPVDVDVVPLPKGASPRPTDSRPRAEDRGPRAEPRAPRTTAPETRLVGGGAPAANATSPIEQAYAKELGELAAMVRERRGELDPATVAVLEHSLKVIDQAIAQSKDALRRDPASGFLQEQLNHALDKKVTLLRTAARLPART